MARRTFFSFHYGPDVGRAQVVRNSWVTKADREAAGFFDGSVFESKKRTSDDALKRFLIDGLENTTVTAVLIGAETASRRWVRYELFRSFIRGNGILGIHINAIKDFHGSTHDGGVNPLTELAYRVEQGRIYFQERTNGIWGTARDVSSMPLSDVAYDFAGRLHHSFDTLFPTYKWFADKGYDNLGSWIEAAARRAGR